MSLRLGDIAPDFKAKTSVGDISFHEYLGDSWGILFSHPADFTPVCTTELGRTAALQEEFAKRNAAFSPSPLPYDRGYVNLFLDKVNQAHEGVDFDFLQGSSGPEVKRDSH